MTPADVAALIADVAASYQLPADLLSAQVQVESGGNPNALRYEPAFFERYILNNPNANAAQYGPFAACSVGLMQMLVETAYERGYTGEPWGLFDPKINLNLGAADMARLVKQTEDYRHALAGYNAGLGNLHAGLSYADKVLAAARRAG